MAVLFWFSKLFGLLEICNQAFDHRTSHRQKKSMLRRKRTAGALCFSASLWVCFHGSDLLLHLPNQLGKLLLTFLFGGGIDIADHTLSIDGGGVAAIPEMVVNLADTAGAGLAALTLVGLEGGGCWLGRENLLLR